MVGYKCSIGKERKGKGKKGKGGTDRKEREEEERKQEGEERNDSDLVRHCAKLVGNVALP